MTEYGTLKQGYADLESNSRLPFYHVHNPNFRAYLAEFVGTFILVLIGDGSVAQYVLGGGGAGHYLSVNLAWGIALLFGIHFSGGVSGGHLNPAVTLTLAIFKRFEWHKVPGYFVAQTLGAFAAALVVFIVYYPWFDIHDPERNTTQGIFATYPNEQIPNWSALANEIIGTALLVSGIFAIGDQLNKPASPYSFPGAVALMLTCIGLAFGLDTGYALNPARDFGPRLFTFFAGWGWKVFTLRDGYFWIPIVGPFVGGLLGADKTLKAVALGYAAIFQPTVITFQLAQAITSDQLVQATMAEYKPGYGGYADLEGNGRLGPFAIRNPDMRAYMAEFIGTFILVLIGDGSVAQYVLGRKGAGDYLSVNLCWGIALLFGVHFSGGVSGGHLNPAVSVTMALFKRFEWRKVPGYIVAQTLGAFVAALVLYIVYFPWLDIVDPEREFTQGIFATYPNPQIPNWAAFANEVVGTALLVGGIFALCDQINKPASPYSFPGAVGLLLTGIGMSFGLNTGYALNPARDFGPRLLTFFGGWGWKVFSSHGGYFWIPILGPFIGAVLGAGMYVGLVELHHPPQ
ncbi:hypothetical protein BBJ29_006392 [Phytophthora kernoviae]|uniref:Aquaporin n=1 Tax=Phytophthora kernoviae TaxID=325452 RepID=A0A3F2RT28_9STRA|nr:hypothetical protein BBJ29_006392 [Phytophthora kernoviae]RLN62860.1 hypothetical protein BBP00_00004501 [Phytophthora kernoviae]